MNQEDRRVIRLQFEDLLPKSAGPEAIRKVMELIDQPTTAKTVYEAAIYAGWCRGYAAAAGDSHRPPAPEGGVFPGLLEPINQRLEVVDLVLGQLGERLHHLEHKSLDLGNVTHELRSGIRRLENADEGAEHPRLVQRINNLSSRLLQLELDRKVSKGP